MNPSSSHGLWQTTKRVIKPPRYSRLYIALIGFLWLFTGLPQLLHLPLGLQSAQADWLSGWDQRIKMTIESDNVDADLSNFPVLVHLSTASGITNADVSAVFDELASDANRTRIAVTKSDGTTECYVEIEDWDDAGEEALLWVKVSGTNSVSSSTDTDLYLYYDSDHAPNTTYVGDVDSAAAQNGDLRRIHC